MTCRLLGGLAGSGARDGLILQTEKALTPGEREGSRQPEEKLHRKQDATGRSFSE